MSVLVTGRTIVFGGVINDDSTAELFSALSDMNIYDDESVTLIINSQGGSLDDGIGIYDYLKTVRFQVHGIVYGQASSAAVLMLQACDTRAIGENSIIMVHAGAVGIDPRHSEESIRQVKTSVDMCRRAVRILAKHCKVSVKCMQSRTRYASSYVGQAAVDAGFVDSVLINKG